jgi:hypothetical protein
VKNHVSSLALAISLLALPAQADVSDEELNSILTPDSVKTSIGKLEFFDGTPTAETAELVYDNLDRMRGVDAFLKGMPAASVNKLIDSSKALGATKSNQVMIMDKLMDSKPLFLTGNTSTLYVIPVLDLKADGPTVVEVPPNMLGAFNDAWFRFVQDVGKAGKDKGKGGKYLVLPPGYTEKIPDGYFVVKSRTYRLWLFMRGNISKGVEVAVKNVTDNLKVYPLSKKNNPPKMEFISGSGKSFNTIHSNDFSFYEHLAHIINYESDEMLDPELRGLFASIGIEKGKPFEPDARMKKILTDAVAIANATARSIVWYPRIDGALLYPDTKSAWVMAYADRNVFFTENGAMNSDARSMFHYAYTGVTPAMAKPRVGQGSQYGIAYLDATKKPFDGSKTYKLNIPKDVPVNDFWALTVYDAQTRSQLQTDQPYPSVGSQTKGFKQNSDGSYDVYFAPKAPEGQENNWLQTMPHKSWFIALRMYGPLEPFIDGTWRPGEIEVVK